MDSQKKALILYASAGHGHEKAAKAVLDAYKETQTINTAEAYDTLSILPPFAGNMYKQVYYWMIQYAPWLWGFFYYALDVAGVYFVARWMRRLVNATTGKPVERFILKENPAVIISTHFLATEVASFLKKTGKIQSKIITVVTDYLPHYIWTASEVDFYTVGLPETKVELIKRGVPEEKIKVLGIPVEKKFLIPHSRPAVCEKLSLEKDKFTVLITSGGAGIGDIQKIAQGILDLQRSIQVLVVCGTNKVLFENLKQASYANPLLKVFGFVTNMDELMDASDLVVGKAGGLTITESFVKTKPLILFRSLPGQEARNVACVNKYQAGFATGSVKEVILKVLEFINAPQKLIAMRENIQKIARPMASKEILELAENES